MKVIARDRLVHLSDSEHSQVTTGTHDQTKQLWPCIHLLLSAPNITILCYSDPKLIRIYHPAEGRRLSRLSKTEQPMY